MALPFAAGLGAAVRQRIYGMVNLKVTTAGDNQVKQFLGWLTNIRGSLLSLGIATIFVDRLIQSFNRAWGFLNETLGATRVADYAKEIERMSYVLGVGTTEMQAFTQASSLFGAEMQDVVDVLGEVQDKVVDLNAGNAKMLEMFRGTGLTGKSFEGMDAISRFALLADGLSRLPDDRRIQSLKALFGDDLARKFGPMLEGGAENVKRLMQAAADSGAVLTKRQMAVAKAFAVAREQFTLVSRGLSNNVAQIFLPILTKLTQALTWLTTKLSVLVQGKAAQWAESLAKSLERLFAPIVNAINYIDTYVMPIEEFVVRLLRGLMMLSVILTGFASSTLGFKIGVLVGLFIAFAGILEDVADYLRGDESFFGKVIGESELLSNLVEALGGAFWALKEVGMSMAGLLVEVFSSPTTMAGITLMIRALTILLLLVKDVIDSITVGLRLIDGAVAIVKTLGNVGVAVFDNAAAVVAGESTKEASDKFLQNSSSTWFDDLIRPFGTPSQEIGKQMGPTFQRTFGTPSSQARVVNFQNNVTIQSADADQTARSVTLDNERLLNRLEGQ